MTTQLGILKSPGNQRDIESKEFLERKIVALQQHMAMEANMSGKKKGKGKGGKPC